MQIIPGLKTFFGFFSVFAGDVRCLLKGQDDGAAILQTAHRIEKGLTIRNPRKLWGWNKVGRLVELIERELGRPSPDLFAVQTGASVFKAYQLAKAESGDREEAERAAKALEQAPRTREFLQTLTVPGGAMSLHATDVVLPGAPEWTEKLFATRHSVREFANREISRDVLLRAVQMALLAPSACNRQPSKVYVLDAAKREQLGYDNTYHANKYLVIVGEINAFTAVEYGDWIVGSSIFAAYLVLALHSLGIGSCIMKKDLHFSDGYNDFLRKACRIPRNEKIVLEIAVGYYPDRFLTAVSNRKNAADVVRFS